MKSEITYESLNGIEKTAIFMLAIGEEQTTKLLTQMDDDEIFEISQTMAILGKVSPEIVEDLLMDFANQMSGTNTLIGSYNSTERFLQNTGLPNDRINAIMEEIRGPAGRTMWEKLGNVNEDTLATFLQKEYPQTVAVILSKVTPDHAARVLTKFPEEFALEVVNRMLKTEAIQKEVLEQIEHTLRTEFMTNLARTQRRDSHELVADIFNNMDRTAETKFLDELEKDTPEAAERIRSLMFTFEDLMRLDASGIQAVIRAVDKERLPVALKGATETMRDLFFNNMSERASKIMKEDMAAMGPVRLRDVEEGQQYIVNVTKELEAKGEIVIASGGDDDEMIY